MFKSMFSHKQIFVYLIILLIGIEIGVLWSSRHGNSLTSSSSTTTVTTTEACRDNKDRDPAAIGIANPQEEILGRPEFIDGGTLRSTIHGWIHVRWKQVNGAENYRVQVWNQAGVEVKNFTTLRTFSYLKNLEVDPRLKETPYSIVVTPIGANETLGKESNKKMAAMLPLRNLAPPTIRSIQTEVDVDPATAETPHTETTKE